MATRKGSSVLRTYALVKQGAKRKKKVTARSDG